MLLGLTVLGTVFATVGTSLAYDWQPYDGHFYALTQNYGTWAEAEAEAVAAGGHLAKIETAEENDWVTEFIKDAHLRDYEQWAGGQGIPNNDNLAWIGANRIGADGNNRESWVWSTGEPVTWWNTYTGPGGFQAQGAHIYLLGMNHPYGPGQWDALPAVDTDFNANPLGVIEAPVPEPSAFVLLATGGIGLIGFALRRRKHAG